MNLRISSDNYDADRYIHNPLRRPSFLSEFSKVAHPSTNTPQSFDKKTPSSFQRSSFGSPRSKPEYNKEDQKKMSSPLRMRRLNPLFSPFSDQRPSVSLGGLSSNPPPNTPKMGAPIEPPYFLGGEKPIDHDLKMNSRSPTDAFPTSSLIAPINNGKGGSVLQQLIEELRVLEPIKSSNPWVSPTSISRLPNEGETLRKEEILARFMQQKVVVDKPEVHVETPELAKPLERDPYPYNPATEGLSLGSLPVSSLSSTPSPFPLKTSEELKAYLYHWTSEEKDFPASSLDRHVKDCSGWHSRKYPSYPQELFLRFDGYVHITDINILTHESKVPSRIDIGIIKWNHPNAPSIEGFPPVKHKSNALSSALKEGNNFPTQVISKEAFSNVGHISYQQFSSPTGARELRIVKLKCTCVALKLTLWQPFGGLLNPFNQVAIIALQFHGHLIQFLPSPRNQRKIPQIEYLIGKQQLVSLDEMTPTSHIIPPSLSSGDSYLNPCIREYLYQLLMGKARALVQEDYDLVQEYDLLLGIYRREGHRLEQLRKEKHEALAKQDYVLAKTVKSKMNTILHYLDHPEQIHRRKYSKDSKKAPLDPEEMPLPSMTSRKSTFSPVSGNSSHRIPSLVGSEKCSSISLSDSSHEDGFLVKMWDETRLAPSKGMLLPNPANSRTHTTASAEASGDNMQVSDESASSSTRRTADKQVTPRSHATASSPDPDSPLDAQRSPINQEDIISQKHKNLILSSSSFSGNVSLSTSGNQKGDYMLPRVPSGLLQPQIRHLDKECDPSGPASSNPRLRASLYKENEGKHTFLEKRPDSLLLTVDSANQRSYHSSSLKPRKSGMIEDKKEPITVELVEKQKVLKEVRLLPSMLEATYAMATANPTKSKETIEYQERESFLIRCEERLSCKRLFASEMKTPTRVSSPSTRLPISSSHKTSYKPKHLPEPNKKCTNRKYVDTTNNPSGNLSPIRCLPRGLQPVYEWERALTELIVNNTRNEIPAEELTVGILFFAQRYVQIFGSYATACLFSRRGPLREAAMNMITSAEGISALRKHCSTTRIFLLLIDYFTLKGYGISDNRPNCVVTACCVLEKIIRSSDIFDINYSTKAMPRKLRKLFFCLLSRITDHNIRIKDTVSGVLHFLVSMYGPQVVMKLLVGDRVNPGIQNFQLAHVELINFFCLAFDIEELAISLSELMERIALPLLEHPSLETRAGAVDLVVNLLLRYPTKLQSFVPRIPSPQMRQIQVLLEVTDAPDENSYSNLSQNIMPKKCHSLPNNCAHSECETHKHLTSGSVNTPIPFERLAQNGSPKGNSQLAGQEFLVSTQDLPNDFQAKQSSIENSGDYAAQPSKSEGILHDADNLSLSRRFLASLTATARPHSSDLCSMETRSSDSDMNSNSATGITNQERFQRSGSPCPVDCRRNHRRK